MPEVISKYPDITIRVLEGAGARCGQGLQQRILTQCPRERFCSTPTGEICVYGLDEIPQMTQISPVEIIQAVPGAAATQEPGLPDSTVPVPPPQTVFVLEMALAISIALIVGAALGVALSRKPR
jgi:hypothetical protein